MALKPAPLGDRKAWVIAPKAPVVRLDLTFGRLVITEQWGQVEFQRGKGKGTRFYIRLPLELYIATLISADYVIPAKGGIQKKPGFRVKPGMTNYTGIMSLCIAQ